MNIKAKFVGGLAVLLAGALASPYACPRREEGGESGKSGEVREGESTEGLGGHWLARH